MARLAFRISLALRRWRRRRDRRAGGRFCMMGLRGDDDRPRGPGWFDSSWDLGQGLEVRWAQPGQPGFEMWLEAMSARPPSPATAMAAADWTANAIEFVVDEARLDALAPMDVAAPAFEAAVVAGPSLQVVAWEAPELQLVPI